jgi:hypothetical protein
MPVMRWLPVFIAAAGLAGCELTMNWVDTTGHHRTGTRAESDYKACASVAGIANLDRKPTYDQREAYRARLLACMFSRGWRAGSLRNF